MGIGSQLEDSGLALHEAVWAGADRKGIVRGGDSSKGIFASHDWKLEIGEKSGVWFP
jgi:hypothetical protein